MPPSRAVLNRDGVKVSKEQANLFSGKETRHDEHIAKAIGAKIYDELVVNGEFYTKKPFAMLRAARRNGILGQVKLVRKRFDYREMQILDAAVELINELEMTNLNGETPDNFNFLLNAARVLASVSGSMETLLATAGHDPEGQNPIIKEFKVSSMIRPSDHDTSLHGILHRAGLIAEESTELTTVGVEIANRLAKA